MAQFLEAFTQLSDGLCSLPAESCFGMRSHDGSVTLQSSLHTSRRIEFSEGNEGFRTGMPDMPWTCHVGDDFAQSSRYAFRPEHAGQLRRRFDAILQRHHH
ncbi:MAG: hypothetical protein H0T95_02755 [Chthoniobacterales bacterium]|nr:hypothetical protein [Chthoniobacterales bacterium]